MTTTEALGMFLFSMISLATLVLVAYFVIQQVMKEKQKDK